MKLNMNKQEVKLISAMITVLDEGGVLNELYDEMKYRYGMSSDEFDAVYSKLDHKINKAMSEQHRMVA